MGLVVNGPPTRGGAEVILTSHDNSYSRAAP